MGDYPDKDQSWRAMSPAGALPDDDYAAIGEMAYRYCGLDLRQGKQELVKSRLGKQLRLRGLSSYSEYCNLVRADKTGTALVEMIDALTTNHTNFFREPLHFDLLRQIAAEAKPRLMGRPFRVWSAACATGEEPYSIAMTLLETLGPAAAIEILATDISTKALVVAREGRYRAERFQDFSPERLSSFLLRGSDAANGWYLVRREVRQLVEFARMNLMKLPSPEKRYPVIFCRNVMIYFDAPTQERLVKRLTEYLEPGGYLMVGHAETLNRIEHALTFVQPAVYRKAEGRSRA